MFHEILNTLLHEFFMKKNIHLLATENDDCITIVKLIDQIHKFAKVHWI